MELVKSFSFSQEEILQGIIYLHTGPFEADVTFGSGAFYRNGIPRPRFCFDISPRRPGVVAADACRLPIKDCCLNSVMFDPPFMARTGPGATLKSRFGELVGTIHDLWKFYFLCLRDIHRVLLRGGWVVMKCQDGVLSGVNNFTHCEIYAMAKTLGFKVVDLFVLGAHHRMMHPAHKRQVHARKFHSYFWVMRKK